MLDFLNQYGSDLITKIGEHLIISMSALFLGCLVAIPIGILVSKNKKVAQSVIAFTSVLQTIPSLALLAMIVPILGVGRVPAIVALFVYSLLPILRNTVLGMDSVDPSTLDAAKGMGLTYGQRVFGVQLPLATPIVMAGVRLSGVYVVSWATLAAYIGAGGLGDFIFTGLNTYNINMIIAATIPVTILALLTDLILEKFEHVITPTTRRKTL